MATTRSSGHDRCFDDLFVFPKQFLQIYQLTRSKRQLWAILTGALPLHPRWGESCCRDLGAWRARGLTLSVAPVWEETSRDVNL